MVSGLSAISDGGSSRDLLVSRALVLLYVSVTRGLESAIGAVTVGVLTGSLGVLGLGLGVAGDVAGSASVVWRFRVERLRPDGTHRAEARASRVVAASLAVTAVFLTVQAVRALLTARRWDARGGP